MGEDSVDIKQQRSTLVRPGDVLRLHVHVLDSRVSKSNPSLGILRWRWQLHNAADIEVLDLEATSLFKLF